MTALLAIGDAPWFLDAVIGLVVIELVGLVVWRARRGTGMPAGEAVTFLGAGLALLVALRTRAAGGSAILFGLAMTAALVCHLWHVRQRWQR